MENLELENKSEKVTKTTTKEVKVTVVPKESKFVTAETIKVHKKLEGTKVPTK